MWSCQDTRLTHLGRSRDQILRKRKRQCKLNCSSCVPLLADLISSARLESLASQTPSISSPSASSMSFSTLSLVQGSSDKPTAQQILPAHMILALLNSPPSYTMPLNKLREVLSAAGAQGTSVTRPIYSCVAKKLLKIERGGGEQIVKFDV